MTEPEPGAEPTSGAEPGPGAGRKPDEEPGQELGLEPGAAARAARRRRLAALGDISVERSADDADDGWSDSAALGEDRDEALRREVPPHHG